MTYPIIDVGEREQLETLGTKEKFWFRDDSGAPWLFKAGRPGTGENWSEKVTCELAKLIGLPCAHYEMARWGELDGVVSPKFVPDHGPLVLGNQVLTHLASVLRPAKPYAAGEYNVAIACALVEKLAPRCTRLSRDSITSDKHPLHYFVGYLVFDCWIGNPDRHDENWGFVFMPDNSIELAPTFDHASGLGVRGSHEEKHARLLTKDRGYSVESYVKKARTPFRGKSGEKLFTLDVVSELMKLDPEAVRYWVEQVDTVTSVQVESILASFSTDIPNSIDAEFAIRMLDANRRRMERFT